MEYHGICVFPIYAQSPAFPLTPQIWLLQHILKSMFPWLFLSCFSNSGAFIHVIAWSSAPLLIWPSRLNEFAWWDADKMLLSIFYVSQWIFIANKGGRHFKKDIIILRQMANEVLSYIITYILYNPSFALQDSELCHIWHKGGYWHGGLLINQNTS